jgi:hypothetical protein
LNCKSTNLKANLFFEHQFPHFLLCLPNMGITSPIFLVLFRRKAADKFVGCLGTSQKICQRSSTKKNLSIETKMQA